MEKIASEASLPGGRIRSNDNFPRSIIAIMGLVLAGNVLWYWAGGMPLHWDSSIHLTEALSAARVTEHAGRPMPLQLLFISWYYPPFVSYIAGSFFLIMGASELAGFVVMQAFLTVLVLSTYGIGRKIMGNGAAAVAAIGLALSPIVLDYSRQFMLDLPLASVTALSVFLLLRTERFTVRGASIWFGVAAGCGFLTKWTFPFFMAGPLIFMLASAFRNRAGRKRSVGNALLALTAGLIVSAPWYIVHIVQILTGRSSELARGNRSLLESAFYYWSVLPDQISWISTILVIVGVGVLLAKRRSGNGILWVWLFGSYALLTVISFKIPRFSLPMLAPILLLGSAGVIDAFDRIGSLRLRRWLFASLSGLYVLQYLASTFVPADSGMAHRLGGWGFTMIGPHTKDWQLVPILGVISTDAEAAGLSHPVVRIIPDHVFFNRHAFNFHALNERMPLSISGIAGIPLFTDYAVVKTHSLGEDTIQRGRITQSILRDTIPPEGLFRVVGRFPLPDGSHALVMRVTPRPVPYSTASAIGEKTRILATQFLQRYLKPIEGYSVEVVPDTGGRSSTGHIASLRVRARRAELGDYAFNQTGLVVSDLDISLHDITVNPSALFAHDSLQLLSLRGLHINHLVISEEDLKQYIEFSSHGKTSVPFLRMRNGSIGVSIEQGTIRAMVDIALSTKENRTIWFAVRGLRINSISLHPALVGAFVESYNPLLGSFEFVQAMRIGNLTIENGRLTID